MESEPRRLRIDGQTVLVIERTPPLPPTLELLLSGGRDPSGRRWNALRVSARSPLRLSGARAACLDETHRLAPWLDGFHMGSDGIARTLRLLACLDCGAVCVRDESFDTLSDLPRGRLPLRRRDHILGWYSGARPRNRVYGRAPM